MKSTFSDMCKVVILTVGNLDADQGCQIFLGTNTKTGINIPNSHKIFPTVIKQAKWS
jgi:hypothetical protein